MISKQLGLRPYICNPVGSVWRLFESLVARTIKANLEQEELESCQTPSAVLACVDSWQVTFRLHSWMEKILPHVFVPHWDLVVRRVIIVKVWSRTDQQPPLLMQGGAHAWWCCLVLNSYPPWRKFCELLIFSQEKKDKLPLEAWKRELAAALSHK